MIRGVLFVIYLHIAWSVIFYFGGMDYPIYAPMAIFFSWGLVPWQSLKSLIEDPVWGEDWGFLLTFIAPQIYLIVLCFVCGRMKRHGTTLAYLLVIGLHTAGSLILLRLVERGFATRGLIVTSTIVSALIAAVYYTLDFLILLERVTPQLSDSIGNGDT